MPRTLLPVFSAFKLLTECYNKEERETFDWLPAHMSRDYILAKEALDRIPESREWLKSYTYEEVEIMPFSNPMGETLLAAFGPHHSGASATRLGWNYHALLNDWDTFVLNSKRAISQELYENNQLTSTDINPFLRLKLYGPSSPAEHEVLLRKEVERLRAAFNIHHDYETTYAMLIELGEEKTENAKREHEEARREYFEERIGVLEHHYKYPSRWYDTNNGSSLFGSLNNITKEMMNEMERRHPGYSEHIARIVADMN